MGISVWSHQSYYENINSDEQINCEYKIPGFESILILPTWSPFEKKTLKKINKGKSLILLFPQIDFFSEEHFAENKIYYLHMVSCSKFYQTMKWNYYYLALWPVVVAVCSHILIKQLTLRVPHIYMSSNKARNYSQ